MQTEKPIDLQTARDLHKAEFARLDLQATQLSRECFAFIRRGQSVPEDLAQKSAVLSGQRNSMATVELEFQKAEKREAAERQRAAEARATAVFSTLDTRLSDHARKADRHLKALCQELQSLKNLATEAREVADAANIPRESWFRLEANTLSGLCLSAILQPLRWDMGLIGPGTVIHDFPKQNAESRLAKLLEGASTDYVPQPEPPLAA